MSAAISFPASHPWQHRNAIVNGIRLHYVTAGEGPLLVLLHGFPEFWYSWRHQIPALAAAGYRVIALDMRGYNTSEKPPGVAAYRRECLVADVRALIAHAGEERAVVVGHDWGGVVAWDLALRHPEVLERLVVLNAPHPAVFSRALVSSTQMLRSWYVLYFQLPLLPEFTFSGFNYATLERVFRDDPVRRDAFSDEDIRRYKRAFSHPGTLTAAINYYRAAVRFPQPRLQMTPDPIRVPTMLIWGEQDRALSTRLTEGLDRWVPGVRVERIAEASHWVQNDAPERVNALLRDFLGAGAPAAG